MKCIGTKCINALLSIKCIKAFHLREYDNICVRNEQMTQWVASDMRSFPRRRPINTISIVAQRGISGTFLFSITVQHTPRDEFSAPLKLLPVARHLLKNTLHYESHCGAICMGITTFVNKGIMLFMNTQITTTTGLYDSSVRLEIVQQIWTVSSRMQEADWNLPMPSYMFHITGTTNGFNIKAQIDSGWRVQSGGITV